MTLEDSSVLVWLTKMSACSCLEGSPPKFNPRTSARPVKDSPQVPDPRFDPLRPQLFSPEGV